MRCNQAIMSAFLAHPRYRSCITSSNLLHTAGTEAARFASPETARAIIRLHTSDLVANQLKSGLWKQNSRGKKPHQYAVSVGILCAIERAGMLTEIGSEILPLRYDPYRPFSELEDRHGVLVRRMFGRSRPEDSALARRLNHQITDNQASGGSWGGTIVETAYAIEHLLELGDAPDSSAIKRGTSWLLAQYRDTVERQGIYVPSLFSSGDGGSELASAQRVIPEAIPVFACYGVLPLIPTGLALRVLVATGYGEDERVIASFESLRTIAIPIDAEAGSGIKGWCSHTCRDLLLDAKKAGR
ncbi:MAG: hypothetical protein ACYC1M_16660 [Armatimonadota bacterium]